VLNELRVRDLALVSSAGASFGPGLNLLTGETGSGKSLIVDALGLSLGARASLDQVRHGSERALVESVFDTAGSPAARQALRDLGQEDSGELVMTREIGKRSLARLNGRPASPGQLREVGRHLVGLHGQHEYQVLLDPEAQLQLLDDFAGAAEPRARVEAAHAAWSSARAELADLERLQARGRHEEDYLRWQLDELQGAAIRVGEDDELAAERSVARHAARLGELAEQALEALRSEAGLPAAAAAVRGAAELDPRLAALRERLGGIEEEMVDAAAELRRYSEGLDSDPSRLEAVEARLALLEGIKRKYGGSLDSAVVERDRLAAQLGRTQDLEAALASAGAGVEAAWSALLEAAAELSAVRSLAAARLGEAVAAELSGLRLEGARFEVRLSARPRPGPDGAEAAEMMFSANPGEPLAPLARVASGGELARVMLAIKTAGSETDRLPTLIFDEVDAGIGGEAALQVGLRLKTLGRKRQVLVVTHLAQIACFADHHLVVEKGAAAEGGRNLVTIRELETPEERARELARMMSGRVTEKALARARELLEEAGS
jgi:DNA repair protein RecN (Recombination protein N)